MTPMRRAAFLAGGTVLFLLLALLSAYLLFPLEEVRGAAARYAAARGVHLRVEKISRTLPPGLRLEKVEVSDPRGPLLRIESLRLRPRLLPLLKGETVLAVSGKMAGGSISGSIPLSAAGNGSLDISGARLEEIPLLKTAAGAEVRGMLKGTVELQRKKGVLSGSVKTEIRGLEVSGAAVGGLALPAASFDTVRGMVRLDRGQAVVESITLQGEGIYSRLSGSAALAPPPLAALDLVLELMPQAAFAEKQKLVFLLLSKYAASPGHFRIPVKGTLSRPSVS